IRQAVGDPFVDDLRAERDPLRVAVRRHLVRFPVVCHFSPSPPDTVAPQGSVAPLWHNTQRAHTAHATITPSHHNLVCQRYLAGCYISSVVFNNSRSGNARSRTSAP